MARLHHRRWYSKRLKLWLWPLVVYLAVVGLLVHLAVPVASYIVMRHFDLTPRQFLLSAVTKMNMDSTLIKDMIMPAPLYKNFQLDGQLREEHPRILFSELSGTTDIDRLARMKQWDEAYRDKGIKAYDACQGGGIMGRAGCWFVTGNNDVANAAIERMKQFNLVKPNASGGYGNGWELAFAYDLLAGYKGFSEADKKIVTDKILQALQDYLVLLNGDSASLWHGRATLASQAWLCAVVLDTGTSVRADAVSQAQAHFLSLIRALALTEAWPEGYNYWINNRAFNIVLAGNAYLNGLKQAQRSDEVRQTLERVGLWQLYAVQPDYRIAQLGDEGPRIDLKDETRRVVDLLAQATDNPLFAAYSRFLANLHGVESYYRGYRWGFRLFNNPMLGLPLKSNADSLEFARRLPKAELFGRRAMNLAYIRSGWTQDDTFISFRAGNTFTHHGHYDAGHFTLFKGAPLAINSGTYGGYFSEHRLNYTIRTVAKNSLLVMRPGEKVQPNRFFEPNVADGGQRIVLPTGSAIRSPSDWMDNIGSGLHLEGGRLVAFHNEKERYVYLMAEITPAYNHPGFDEGGSGGKVREVVRELFYLYAEDRLLIHDYVVSTNASFKKKWLLHTAARPDVKGLQLLKGEMDNGILESQAALALIANGQGRLRLDRLYPEDALIRLVGGPDFRFYVEVDGDDSDLDGRNMSNGAKLEPWFEAGMWRIEVQPAQDRIVDHFLIALSPSLKTYRDDVVRPLPLNGAAKGAVTSDNLVLFVAQQERDHLTFDYAGGKRKLYIMGLPSLAHLRATNGGYTAMVNANDAGVAVVEMDEFSPGVLELKW